MHTCNPATARIPAWLVLLAAISLLPVWNSCQAVDAVISVHGLFRDKALLKIDGKRRLLTAGETTPEGIKLVHANSRQAVLEIDGKQAVYTLGDHIGGKRAAAPNKPEARLWSNERGMFTTVGTINGFPVSFLLDTGATAVALNANEARRLGVDYKSRGQKTGIQTASGAEVAYRVKLTSVGLGDIKLYNVDAVVLEGTSPVTPLLGMSFLGNLQIENRGNMMLLRQNY
jgi:aspartyl protease family protein